MYENMITNNCLAELYTKNGLELGIKFEDDEAKASSPTGSTDMGNVSHVVPSIHPMFYIGTLAANHTRDFTTATGRCTKEISNKVSTVDNRLPNCADF